jgi:outer membrane receptor protein involved in Fe transport
MTSKRCALRVTLLSMAVSGSSLADTDELRSILSETVVTSASASAETGSTAPATSVTISAEELRTYGIRSLDEAIDFLALGVVTSDTLATPDIGARGVLLRGDNGKHFLLLVNGHAVNDPLFGAARFDHGSGVPIEMVDHIEVIVGPGSVLFGSNAMLGVINVITKSASQMSGGEVMAEYEPGASARAGAGAGFGFSLFGADGEFTSYVTHQRRFGPDLNFELQPFSQSPTTNEPVNYGPNGQPGRWGGVLREAYFNRASSGVVRVRLGDLQLNVFASAYERGIPYSTGAVAVDFDDPGSDERDRALRFDLKHETYLNDYISLTSRAYADGFDYRRRINRAADLACLENDFPTCQLYQAGLARWAGAEMRLNVNWLSDSSLVTMLGTDARMRWVRAKEDATNADTGAPFAPSAGLIDESGGLISPYLEQIYAPTAWLRLNAGARLDADERFSPILSPRVAVALSPFEKTTFKTSYSQGFRAPAWAETNPVERKQVPASRLEPEFVRSVEASLEQRIAASRLRIGVFRTWWEDLIEPHVLSQRELQEAQERGEIPISQGGAVRYQNVSNLDNYGYDASLRGSLVEGRLRYGFNATAAYTRQRVAGQTRRLPVAPQLFGNARAAYRFSDDLPMPGVAVRWAGKRLVDRAYDATWDQFPEVRGFVEVRVTLSGRVPLVPGLEYRASASYDSSEEGPYVVGLRPYARTATQALFTNPVDSFTGFLGLSYAFGRSNEPSQEEP